MLIDRCVASATRLHAVFAVLALPLFVASCGGASPAAPTPADALDQRTTSQHVDFLYASGDTVDGRAVAQHSEHRAEEHGHDRPAEIVVHTST
jgi:hypothetical protein